MLIPVLRTANLLLQREGWCLFWRTRWCQDKVAMYSGGGWLLLIAGTGTPLSQKPLFYFAAIYPEPAFLSKSSNQGESLQPRLHPECGEQNWAKLSSHQNSLCKLDLSLVSFVSWKLRSKSLKFQSALRNPRVKCRNCAGSTSLCSLSLILG